MPSKGRKRKMFPAINNPKMYLDWVRKNGKKIVKRSLNKKRIKIKK